MPSVFLNDTAPLLNAAGQPLRQPEVLSPAGNWQCARAAVENGADAIYFGVGRFNARVRADNFTDADLPELMAFLHRRGVRGYVTFNTLIFANELAEAEVSLRAIIASGVDAAIVQDVGICRLIRRLSPDFPIHASTQMTVTSAAGVEFVRELGASLAVLARECSLQEITKLQQELASRNQTLPLETFVHGALCVAYSGQCLTSESLGGRSANRGECAQACRLPYDLLADGRQVPLGDRKYLLSPQDLAGVEVIPQLIRAGVSSLKIEGRLKSPEYVAAITRVYRKAVDQVYTALLRENGTGGKSGTGAAETEAFRLRRDSAYELEMSFSRGLDTGWLNGIDNRKLVHARFGKKRGVFLGKVEQAQEGRVRLRLDAPLKPGDGVVFDDGKPEDGEEGGFVYGIDAQRDGTAWVRFAREALDWRRIRPGQLLWKTSDPELTKQLRQTFSGEQVRFQRPIAIRVHGAAGAPLRVSFDDGQGRVVRGESAVPLAPAENLPLDEAVLAVQLGRLGGTPFSLGELSAELDGAVMLPLRELNRLRRELVERLDALRAAPRRWTLNDAAARADFGFHPADFGARTTTPPEIIPVIRLPEQLDAALRWGARTIYCEFEEPRKYREAVARVRAFNATATQPVEIWVMPPRVFKQGEDWILQQVRACDADGYLVRNHEHLRYFAGCRRRGDFSLNIANPLAAEFFKERFALERLNASYDLNATQLDALLAAAPAAWFEVTLHQHMPMFHMEHCVFCAFLSEGKDFRDCGRPCEKHTVRLRDRVGAEHLLRADAGCRNTVFNARAQTGAEFADRLLARGVRHFRIEFVDESADTLLLTLNRYAALLRGEISGGQLWRELKLHNQLGVTRGTLLDPAATGPSR